ncbi:hypothetical protein GGR88_000802 [Sphingomonas jejuensis]|uniref:NfeD-like C-terminal domain-containing protein n=1 Tax=Sphingomonas jejuensis TaxID=904715 RepID=A0ABX0XJ18_9SPHN|nr:NfeD family protein [Sphingomonas jejuensis]NJC33328.1 hypothetical protein [Sphingomonas jejuensis]
MNPSDLDPAWYWMGLALLLAIAELLVPGVFLVWLAAAAAGTAVVTWGLAPPLVVQLIAFTAFAIAAVLGGRRWYVTHPVASQDPFINERAIRLIGEEVRATTAFQNGRGRIRLGDSEWSARGPDCAEGACLTIIGSEGATLIVRPVEMLR